MNAKEIMGNKRLMGLFALIAAAALLMVYGNFPVKSEEKPTGDTRTMLEQELSDVLSEVRGAGKVSVFVMLSDDGVRSYEKNVRRDETAKEETTVLSGSDNSPAVVKYSFPSVKGVIITAQGAENESVRQNLENAVTAALGVAAHRVCVLAGK